MHTSNFRGGKKYGATKEQRYYMYYHYSKKYKMKAVYHCVRLILKVQCV